MNISFLRSIVKVIYSSHSRLFCQLRFINLLEPLRLKMHLSPLSVVGRVIQLEPIPNADFVEVATSECGELGIWKGVVNKGSLTAGQLCTVFLHDAIVPQLPQLSFMEKHKWRVSMKRFKGAPSECLIVNNLTDHDYGTVLDEILGVMKFEKPVDLKMRATGIKPFPHFLPITDEPNFQAKPTLVNDYMKGCECVATLKYDGTSTTVFNYKGEFGVCSRNLQLKEEEGNLYWAVAKKYNLQETLPDGIAIQFETCGPKVQKNPHKLPSPSGYLFSGIDIEKREYLSFAELASLAELLKIPLVKNLQSFVLENTDGDYLRTFSETLAVDENGKPLEGIVIRSVERFPIGAKRSFKVLNLSYKH